jgi:hypothetical protein
VSETVRESEHKPYRGYLHRRKFSSGQFRSVQFSLALALTAVALAGLLSLLFSVIR